MVLLSVGLHQSALIKHLELGHVLSHCVAVMGGGSMLKTLPALNVFDEAEAALTEE